MSARRKPRAAKKSPPKPVGLLHARRDAKLKNLRGEQKASFIEWFSVSPDFARSQCRKVLGISVSLTPIYEAIAFFKLQEKFQQVEAEARVRMQEQVRRDPAMTPEQRDAAIDENFAMIAAATGDTETLLEFRKLALKKQELDSKNKATAATLKQRAKELDRKERELALNTLKWQNDVAEKILTGELRKAAEKINRSDISHAAKIAEMRKLAFADVDALEASGKLEIPKS